MIISAPSPNFNARTLPISMLVLHYTGMRTGAAALERLCDKAAKVSAHYLIEEDGRVFSLIDESHRAWHAGVGHWRGVSDINSASIGIEIVNGGHDFGLPAFAPAQIEALIPLCQKIIARHCILPHNIVGHSDIAPARKQDPGERFPWQRLAAKGMGLWPKPEDLEKQTPENARPERLRTDLQRIGYCLNSNDAHAVIAAFQRRFLPTSITGKPCVKTCATARSIARMSPAW